jgi:pteridine reductase
MNNMPLAIVTGGAQRLGRAFALSLAEMGYAILVHYHQSSLLASETVEQAHKYDVPAFSFQADLTKPDQVERLFNFVDELLASQESGVSHLFLLVNSAARFTSVQALNISVSEWDATMELNLRAPYLCASQAARRMQKSGLIVNVTDVGAQKTWSRFPAYTVSKAGLEALTRILARALAPEIRVNAIAPGLVLPADSIPSDEWERLYARTPLNRPARLKEVTSALGYLIKNTYVTGQTIVVDGGYSLL